VAFSAVKRLGPLPARRTRQRIFCFWLGDTNMTWFVYGFRSRGALLAVGHVRWTAATNTGLRNSRDHTSRTHHAFWRWRCLSHSYSLLHAAVPADSFSQTRLNLPTPPPAPAADALVTFANDLPFLNISPTRSPALTSCGFNYASLRCRVGHYTTPHLPLFTCRLLGPHARAFAAFATAYHFVRQPSTWLCNWIPPSSTLLTTDIFGPYGFILTDSTGV